VNIESGVLMSASLIGIAGGIVGSQSLDEQADHYFQRVIEQSVLLFRKVPQFGNTMMGLSKKFKSSIVETDILLTFFESHKVLISSNEHLGYCIVTANKIPFNVAKPLSESAYKMWVKTRDPNYKGSYCHYSGEPGETTFSKPILKRNWEKARGT
jgi:hypothetical protein